MKQLIAELNRRNVPRVAITYLAAAWLLVEIADTTFPRFGFEDSAVRNVIVLLAIGFVPALVLAWFFELTPEGLTRDQEYLSDGIAEKLGVSYILEGSVRKVGTRLRRQATGINRF